MTTDTTLNVAHTLAGLPVSDMDRAEDWYGRLFGRPADAAPMDILRDFWISELATVQLVLDTEHPGGGMLTLDVASIDEAVAGLEARGLRSRRDDTTSDKVRLGMLTDPDGNRITLIETKPGFSNQKTGA